jgi:hypothetical protein
MRWVCMAMELAALAGAGCATRNVPDHYPRTSAASPEAPLGRPLEVTTSLTDRVPVPCVRCAERAAAAPAPSSQGHADHGGHDGGK